MSYALQGLGASGFGAITFEPSAVWADWLAGSAGDNAAGARAADEIRAALGQLGYGTEKIGQSWGTPQDKAAYSAFVQQQNLPASSNGSWWPTQLGITRLGDLVKQGGTPGGGSSQQFHLENGVVVPGAAPGSSTASMSTGAKIGLVVVALGILGAAAIFSKKRSPSGYGRASQASVGY